MQRSRAIRLVLALAVGLVFWFVLHRGNSETKQQQALGSWAQKYGNQESKAIGGVFSALDLSLQSHPTSIAASICGEGLNEFRRVDSLPAPPSTSMRATWIEMREVGTATFSDCESAVNATSRTSRNAFTTRMVSETTRFIRLNSTFISDAQAVGFTITHS